MHAAGSLVVPLIALLAGGSPTVAQTSAGGDTDAAISDPPEQSAAERTELEPTALKPIDLSALPPLIVEIENVDLDSVHSGIICERVRVLYSLVPRTFCTTRERFLARQGRSNRERVARQLQTLREIRRYQMRNEIERAANSQF